MTSTATAHSKKEGGTYVEPRGGNEAFAAQALACQRELGIDNAKLNVNGGSIAIGHPLGCSGARLATTLIHQMARTGASRGIASLCVGVGQGLATVFERE